MGSAFVLALDIPDDSYNVTMKYEPWHLCVCVICSQSVSVFILCSQSVSVAIPCSQCPSGKIPRGYVLCCTVLACYSILLFFISTESISASHWPYWMPTNPCMAHYNEQDRMFLLHVCTVDCLC
ncbi:hypothetical protein BDF14DRAFT_1767931 [Spinellus fusiger]|nr:hypothetical protein BDF14DRAFT_1767931 [Spinellus fusiger]